MKNLKQLVENWDKCAKEYEKRAENPTNSYLKERFFAIASIFRLCAAQLEEHISKGDL